MEDTTVPAANLLAGPSTYDPMLLIAGEGLLSTVELDHPRVTIGRAAGCDVVIDHPALSRRHAEVTSEHGVHVRDLSSTNGTRIGGELRRGGEAQRLSPSEVFHIGPFSFMLVARGRPQEPSLSMRDMIRVPDPTVAGVPSVVGRIAAGRASVLVLGETGVGKEVLAETVHTLSRRTGPLTRINCAALSESLLESELFGYEKGAFTGAATSKVGLLEGSQSGTVFLDEVGELPLAIQAKLLRAVERHEVLRVGAVRPQAIDVRFVAATNRDLAAEVEAGRFRRDLFFRLDGVTMTIPPLRERRGMITNLALTFLRNATPPGESPPGLAPEVLTALESYHWPGNVRELRAVLERALVIARDRNIGVRHLMFATSARSAAPAAPPPPPEPAMTASEPSSEPLSLDDAERQERARIIAALELCAGNQTRAARHLGIGRTSLLQKLRLYRIPRPRT